MTAITVVGNQWSDEGKGKATDFLSKDAAMAICSNGGSNTGHTIEIGDKTFKMRLIPSGIFATKKGAVIGNDVVINPEVMFGELSSLEKEGIDINGLRISNRAHVIMPYHILQDTYQEEAKSNRKTGTIKNGIDPCYIDKTSRISIRVCDLLEGDTFEGELHTNLTEKNALFTKVYNEPALKFEDISGRYLEHGQKMKKYVTDTSVIINDALDKNEKVLFEGTQGMMLDIDGGTYPYVTSSNTISSGIAPSVGMGANRLNTIVGVCRAYTTRVGEGPFLTELLDEVGDRTHETAHEYGTVIGCPRRVGWFDSVALRHAKHVAGINALSLSLLDIFFGFDGIKITTAYELDGKKIDYYPASLEELYRCKPVYEELPAWDEDITNVKTWEDLPEDARKLLNHVSELVGVPLVTVSVDPDREQAIVLENPWEM